MMPLLRKVTLKHSITHMQKHGLLMTQFHSIIQGKQRTEDYLYSQQQIVMPCCENYYQYFFKQNTMHLVKEGYLGWKTFIFILNLKSLCSSSVVFKFQWKRALHPSSKSEKQPKLNDSSYQREQPKIKSPQLIQVLISSEIENVSFSLHLFLSFFIFHLFPPSSYCFLCLFNYWV